jgi:hypothetical protein
VLHAARAMNDTHNPSGTSGSDRPGDDRSTTRQSTSRSQQPADRSGGSGQKQIGSDLERRGDDNPRDSSDRGDTQH